MKSLYIRAGQNQNGVGRASVIKLWSAATIHTMEIARREPRFRTFPVVKHELRTHENIRHTIRGCSFCCEMRKGLSQNQKLQTRYDCEFDSFGQAVARRKLRRLKRGQKNR